MGAKLMLDRPCSYRIRVQGKLDEDWADYFYGMNINRGNAGGLTPVTELSGSLASQAMFQEVLQKLYNLGFALISAEKIEPA